MNIATADAIPPAGGGECEILTVERADVDLIDQAATGSWIRANRPDVVFLAAAKVHGIHAQRPLRQPPG